MMKTIIPYKELIYCKDEVKSIGNRPGVYFMVDSNGIVMYIGKSKSLSKRVRSYFNKVHEREKINRMVMFIDQIKILETETHLDAMMLEIEMIKLFRPLYNSQFKKSVNYSYLDLSSKSVIAISAKKPKKGYLGPFRNSDNLEIFKSLVDKISPIGNKLTFKIIPKRLSVDEVKDTQHFILKIFKDEASLSVFTDRLYALMEEFIEVTEYESAAFIKKAIEVVDYLSRTTLKQKEQLHYVKIEGGFKVYLIEDYMVKATALSKGDSDQLVFIDFDLKLSDKDILDHQLVIFHELK